MPQNDNTDIFRWADFFRGVRQSIPVMLGYLPVSFAFGVVAAQAGLSVLETLLMGLFVFAGSSQFVAVNMIMAGAPALSIIITTCAVNARHLVMSAALVPYVRHWSRKFQLLASFGMADEPFVLNIGNYSSRGVSRGQTLGINFFLYLSWALPAGIGVISGDLIGDVRPFGLDFALPAVFIALLVPYCKNRRFLCAALISALVSIVLYLHGVRQWNVIIATVAAASLTMLLPFGGAGQGGGREKDAAGTTGGPDPEAETRPEHQERREVEV